MKQYIENRVREVAQYILDTKSTVRATAKQFGVSKTTVHKDIVENLPKLNPLLADEVMSVLQINKAERHIRGGESTRKLYLEKKELI